MAALQRLQFGLLLVTLSVGCSRPPMPTHFAAAGMAHRHPDGRMVTHASLDARDARTFARFVLAEIPSLLARIRCHCCRFTVSQCLRGACEDLCPMCVGLAREVYALHLQGISDDDVVERMHDFELDG